MQLIDMITKSRKMWGLLLIKAIQALPVDDTVEDDFVEESSVLTAMLTTLMQVK